MAHRPSIKDVADQAGVSASTVSRVITGYQYIKPKTRQLVIEAIEKLDYQPHRVARSLRQKRTNLIGLVVSTIENIFFTEVARAAEQTALQHGYNLIVCNTDESAKQEETYLRILSQQMVAGIILAPAPGRNQHLLDYQSDDFAMVLINRRLSHLPFASVTANDDEAAFEAVSTLINAGRERIAAITGLADTYTTQIRLDGYRRALLTAGLPLEPKLEITGQAHLDGGYQATHQLMQQSVRPDALFVFNNFMTQGVIMALQDLGIRWPDQIDIAAFGAFKGARLYQPPLTLIEQPTHEMGQRAVEMLIAQIEKQDDCQPEAVVLRNHLIPRQVWLNQREARLVQLGVQ